MMIIDKSFEEIQKRESLLESQKVEIETKYKKLRDKYEKVKFSLSVK